MLIRISGFDMFVDKAEGLGSRMVERRDNISDNVNKKNDEIHARLESLSSISADLLTLQIWRFIVSDVLACLALICAPSSLRLRARDIEIIEAVAVLTEEWWGAVLAVMVAWYNGTEGGNALANVVVWEGGCGRAAICDSCQ